MPIYVSGSSGGITTLSGSQTTTSGSGGETTYGSAGTSGSQGSVLSGSYFPFYLGTPGVANSGTGSYPSPVTGAMTIVSGSGANCHKIYVYMGAQFGGWSYLTGSPDCLD